MYLDDLDRRLLNLVQVEFPFTERPYATLGQRLGIDETNVIHRLQQLKAEQQIRQISPVLEARKLGYQSTLVAMRVGKEHLARAEQLISEHPGVSHGYERNHYFNVWFTLGAFSAVNIDTELERLTSSFTTEAIVVLPATKLFKIGVYFDMTENGQSPAGGSTQSSGALPVETELLPIDRLVINELQQDLLLAPAPFTPMATHLGMKVEHFLAQCQSLSQRGIIRRFGAAINHHRAGFTANAMTCWVASPKVVDVAGQKLASLQEVSHCYERKTSPLWQYNLFAMIHGHSREACQEIADKVSRETGLTDYVLLFSTKEFKKTRTKYLV